MRVTGQSNPPAASDSPPGVATLRNTGVVETSLRAVAVSVLVLIVSAPLTSLPSKERALDFMGIVPEGFF